LFFSPSWLPSSPRQRFLLNVTRHRQVFAVAVVRFVVDGQDVFHAHQVGHDALEHLAFGFGGDRSSPAALEQLPAALGEFDAFAQFEGVVVGDDDLGAGDVVEQVARHQFAAL
jgi:hypothetical protein